MNIEAQKHLNSIVNKSLHELTATDIIFLKARRGYLTDEQTELYESVLNSEVTPSKAVPAIDAPVVKTKKDDISLTSVLKEKVSGMKYNELLLQAKQFGFVPTGKGRVKRDDLEHFMLENS